MKRSGYRGLFLTLFLSVVFPIYAFASSELLLSPASGSYKVDEAIPAKVIIRSPEKLAAVEASLEFDVKNISVRILTTSPDVSWVVAPTVDNEKGELRFSGMVSKTAINPLELMTLEVKGLRPGSQELHFVSGASTVAADGTGGNTLGKITQASFDITTSEQYADGTTTGEVLGASDEEFRIYSPQIVDQSGWYSLRDATVMWTKPAGMPPLLLGLTKKHDDVGYKPAPKGTTTKELKDLDPGEWFFHLTPEGKGLSDTIHFRIAIDGEAPIIATSTEIVREDETDPNVAFRIETEDSISGVAYHEISVNGGGVTKWVDDGSHEYRFVSSAYGENDLVISAFDFAGNRSESHVRFTVKPLPKPEIKLQKEKFGEASPIIAEIKGLPFASVKVVFEGGLVRHDDIIKLNGEGRGTYILKESILPGNYEISAIQTTESKASSDTPEVVGVIITPSILGYIGRNVALSIALVPVLVLLAIYGLWRIGLFAFITRYHLRKKSLQKVAPLSLAAPTSPQRNTKVVTAPLLIKRTVRVSTVGGVVDLRKK